MSLTATLKGHIVRRSRVLLVPGTLAITLLLGGALAGCSTDGSTATDTATTTSSAPAAAATLPSDFPKADVPLVDGKILVATGGASTGWSVTVVPSAAGGFDAAQAALTKAGFTVTSSKPGSVYLSGPKYDILLTSPGDTVTYAISPA